MDNMFTLKKNTFEKLRPEITLCGVNSFFLNSVRMILEDFKFWSPTSSEQLTVHYLNDATLIDLLISLKKINASHRNVIFCGERTFHLLRGVYFKTNVLILPQNISVVKLKEELNFWWYRCNHRISYVFGSELSDVLTPTEWKIIRLFCAGFQTEDISNIKEIKIKTVSSHKRNAMHKIHAKTNQHLYVKVKLLTVLNKLN